MPTASNVTAIRGRKVSDWLRRLAEKHPTSKAAAVVLVNPNGRVATEWLDGSHESRHELISGASTLVQRLCADAVSVAVSREDD